jgi:hypothetical protein
MSFGAQLVQNLDYLQTALDLGAIIQLRGSDCGVDDSFAALARAKAKKSESGQEDGSHEAYRRTRYTC